MEEYRKVLVLPLKEKWYRMIESGIKTEEYRELTPYWCNRILYHCSLGINGYWGDSTTNPNERGVLIKAIEFNKNNPYVTLHHLLIENIPKSFRCYNEYESIIFIPYILPLFTALIPYSLYLSYSCSTCSS